MDEVASSSELFRWSISHSKLGGCHLEKSSWATLISRDFYFRSRARRSFEKIKVCEQTTDLILDWHDRGFVFQQVRVMLIYHANWRSIYFDLFAFSLSTADPFVHPVVCILVSQRYRAGYKAAFKNILSTFYGWTCNCTCESKVNVHPMEYPGSGAGLDKLRNRVPWTHGNVNTMSLTDRPSIIRLGVIPEAEETQD